MIGLGGGFSPEPLEAREGAPLSAFGIVNERKKVCSYVKVYG